MKRTVVAVLGFFLCLGFVGSGLLQGAEKYPVKPIECIVALEAGADGDVMVRPVLAKMTQKLGQPIIVVNKPGGGSSIGYRAIHDAKPDGYTFGWYSATLITNKLSALLPYDYHDFVMLGSHATYFPVIIASTKSKHKFDTLKDVVSYAKAHPGDVSMATGSVGQSWWVAAMAFIDATGIKLNVIPVPGTGAMTVAQVAGGHADIGVAAMGSAKSMVDSGQVKFLATLGEERSAAPYDKYPSVKELGWDVAWESTNGLMAPPKFPKQYTDILIAAYKEATYAPDFKKFATELNARWEFIPPEQIVSTFDKRRTIVREIMRNAGLLKEK
jgi:tripartite-type tricarboxylate transporter receptor subunit TctC